MKFKKIMISIIIVTIFFLINFNKTVYAADTWVQDAFDAANSFLKDTEVEDDLGIFETLLIQFKNIIKGVNIVLLVLLAGLSIIALAVVGIKYIMAGGSPHQKEEAKKSLHTVFIGMIYGFGAYVIWTTSMQVVELIMGAFSK